MNTFISFHQKQSGVVLLEALISLLIFSLGIIGLISLQAASVASTTDAKNRADAAFLANQIIGQMWVAKDVASLAAFDLNSGAAPCTGGAPAAGHPAEDWANQVSKLLPGMPSGKGQSIVVDAVTPGLVTVTVCWHPNDGSADHVHTVSAMIQNSN